MLSKALSPKNQAVNHGKGRFSSASKADSAGLDREGPCDIMVAIFTL
jgi:hypothetical protein